MGQPPVAHFLCQPLSSTQCRPPGVPKAQAVANGSRPQESTCPHHFGKRHQLILPCQKRLPHLTRFRNLPPKFPEPLKRAGHAERDFIAALLLDCEPESSTKIPLIPRQR